MNVTTDRETFTISRELEYFSETELTKQIGYHRRFWVLAIVKELIDNALDNCEENGIMPTITVDIEPDSITVTDNGTGIPPETVGKMLDFAHRVSSREVYRSISRGAMGNAGKCVIAIPYVVGDGAGHVTIDAQCIHHDISVTLDRIAQTPVSPGAQKGIFRTFGEGELLAESRLRKRSHVIQSVRGST